MTTPKPAGRPRPAPTRVTVARADWLAPRLRRITFTGPGLAGFTWPGPGSHFKVLIPEPGAPDVVLPEPDGDGMVRYDPAVPLTMRTYTPRAWRAAGATGPGTPAEIDVDFVVHGHGPASTWAAGTGPGARAALGPARARYELSPQARELVLAGDESAIPAIATILAARPAGLPTRVYLEVHDDTDRLDLPGDERVTLTWLSRASAGVEPDAVPGRLLAARLADTDFPAGTAVWVGCEAHVVREIRHTLLVDKGLAREAIVTRGYWRTGVANHPDGDHGDGDIPTRG